MPLTCEKLRAPQDLSLSDYMCVFHTEISQFRFWRPVTGEAPTEHISYSVTCLRQNCHCENGFMGYFQNGRQRKWNLFNFLIITERQIWFLNQYFQGPEIHGNIIWPRVVFLPGINGYFSCFSKWPPPKIQYNI